MKEEYCDNFEFTEEIKTILNVEVELYVYSDTKEFNYNGKWQHSPPTKQRFDLEDISYFREQTQGDKYNSNCNWIMDSTVMPTKWCMMVYYDKYEFKHKVIPVVGTPKKLNEQLDTLKDRYYKQNKKLFKLQGKIKELFLTEDIENI